MYREGRRAATTNTASSVFFEQHGASHNFHKHSSSEGSGDDIEDDDFAHTYCGDQSNFEANNADNKYSRKKIALNQDPSQPMVFDEQRAKFRAYVRDHWARSSNTQTPALDNSVQIRPKSNDSSEGRPHHDLPCRSARGVGLKYGQTRNSSNGYIPLPTTENSNSFMTNPAAQRATPVNFTQNVGDLSAILPPKPSNTRFMTTKAANTAPLRDRSGQGSRITTNNEHSTSLDHSRHILSKEIESSAMLLNDYGAIEEATQLKSSFARRQNPNHQRQPSSSMLLNHATFNPFRSRSTPPLPQQLSQSSDAMRKLTFQPPEPTPPRHTTEDISEHQHRSTELMVRRTSSGQILQGKQMHHIEELERVITEKMGIIKRIDHMIQLNHHKKKDEGSGVGEQRSNSVPARLPGRPMLPRSNSPPHRAEIRNSQQDYGNAASLVKGVHEEAKSKGSRVRSRTRSRGKQGTGTATSAPNSKVAILTRKKNRYKAKLLALRLQAQMQEQQLIRLSQNLNGVESHTFSVKTENEQMQGQLAQMREEYAKQSDQLGSAHAELQCNQQLVAQLKLQLSQRGETILEMKREHTELQVSTRKVQNDLFEKQKELEVVQDGFERATVEKQTYKERVEQQEQELKELKKAHEETQREFEVFRADIDTKNSLITQLKDQILEVTRIKREEDEKVKRNQEIEQLKDLIGSLTTQIVDRKGGTKMLSKAVGEYPTLALLDQAQSDRTSADDCVSSEPKPRENVPKQHPHHLRVVSSATQTDVMSQDVCSCHGFAEEPLLVHTNNHSTCYDQSQDIINSPESLQHKFAAHEVSQHRRESRHGSSCGRKKAQNPYKRRSNSVQSPDSNHSCCRRSDASRSPSNTGKRDRHRRRSAHSRSDRASSTTMNANLLSLQLQRQQDGERIAELEGFCADLVKQIEQWRRLDRQGRLIHTRIEEHLLDNTQAENINQSNSGSASANKQLMTTLERQKASTAPIVYDHSALAHKQVLHR